MRIVVQTAIAIESSMLKQLLQRLNLALIFILLLPVLQNILLFKDVAIFKKRIFFNSDTKLISVEHIQSLQHMTDYLIQLHIIF